MKSTPTPQKMKHFKKRRIVPACIIAAGFFGAASLSQATAINYDMWQATHSGNPLDYLHEMWGSRDTDYDLNYAATWQLGFDTEHDIVESIKVSFSFADDNPNKKNGSEVDAKEHVDITLGYSPETKIWNDVEVDGSHSGYHTISMSLNALDHFDVFQDLQEDGKLRYSVTIQDLLYSSSNPSYWLEDTYLKVAKIEVWTTPKSNSVPDSGSTFIAFGLGLLGLGGVRRFLTKA